MEKWKNIIKNEKVSSISSPTTSESKNKLFVNSKKKKTQKK